MRSDATIGTRTDGFTWCRQRKRMKAIVIHEFGPPDVLKYESVPDPEPRAGEVRIRIHAATVNRVLDVSLRAGKEAARGPKLPLIPGVDCAGVVDAVGAGVTRWKKGMRVAAAGVMPLDVCGEDDSDYRGPEGMMGIKRPGGFAEMVAVPACAKVIATAGSDDRVQTGLALGADCGINYNKQDLAAEVMAFTGGKGVNVLYDNVANPKVLPGAFRAIGFDGRLVTAGAHAGPNVTIDFSHLYHKRITIKGRPGYHPPDVAKCFLAAAEGKVRAQIERVLPLSRAPEAHRLIESGEATGKLVLDPTQVYSLPVQGGIMPGACAGSALVPGFRSS